MGRGQAWTGIDPSREGLDTKEIKKLRGALKRIVEEFDQLNGMECSGGCGNCIKCIAKQALREGNHEHIITQEDASA
jgi:hypothetical protein